MCCVVRTEIWFRETLFQYLILQHKLLSLRIVCSIWSTIAIAFNSRHKMPRIKARISLSLCWGKHQTYSFYAIITMLMTAHNIHFWIKHHFIVCCLIVALNTPSTFSFGPRERKSGSFFLFVFVWHCETMHEWKIQTFLSVCLFNLRFRSFIC